MSNTNLLGSFGGQAGDALMFRNKVINGSMTIDQRNADAAITYTAGNSAYPVDRFTASLFGATYSGNVMSAQLVSDAPAGFTNSLRITALQNVTFDSNKLGAFITHKIEGFNVADLDFGLSTVKTVCISFWVKSNKTGTVSVSIENNAADRSYGTTVTISQAATWEYKTVIISGDSAGTWLKDNGAGLALNIGIASNGSWLVGAAGSWSATRAVFNSAQTNFLSATNDYLAITGVQLEAGPTATPFERRPYSVELDMCQRYYEDTATDIYLFCTNSTSGAAYYFSVPFKITKRIAPATGNVTLINANNNGFPAAPSSFSSATVDAVRTVRVANSSISGAFFSDRIKVDVEL